MDFAFLPDSLANDDAAASEALHEAALHQADAHLYGSLQAWRQQPLQEAVNEDASELASLSKALIGDERLQALLVTDYLANLSPSEFATVANTMAQDTLAQLTHLAQSYPYVDYRDSEHYEP
ncbi:MAG: hypothetical protein U0003_04230 [Vampirovibrionales bacterium]